MIKGCLSYGQFRYKGLEENYIFASEASAIGTVFIVSHTLIQSYIIHVDSLFFPLSNPSTARVVLWLHEKKM